MISRLPSDERAFYARQILLPAVGEAGQQRLRDASVLVVGAGGLGSPTALYLAAAGVGRIGIVDDDRVEASNLHRQTLYTYGDVGRPKAEAAAERLRALNPFIEVQAHSERLGEDNALGLVSGYDIVADGTDTFATRYLVNDACVLAGRPNVFASITRYSGQASVFAAPGGPCYRCLFPDPAPEGSVPSCAEGGVLGVLPGFFGTLQATEALKLLLGLGEPLVGRLLLADLAAARFQTLQVSRDPACPVCGDTPTLTRPASPGPSTLACMSVPDISVRELSERLASDAPPFVLDVRRADEYAIANIEGALIPLDELPDRVSELEPHRSDDMIVVHCRSGARSAKAVEVLHAHGFTNAVNLRGGILAWSDEVDPSVPKY